MITFTSCKLVLFVASAIAFFNRSHASRGSVFDITSRPAGDQFPGRRWALLIAGSSGFYNYRHQADICHAYQLLRKNGIEEENIVVFMADDIANHPENPHPGTLINRPYGEDVYSGVPKDYTGQDVTVQNFLAVLRGDKSAVSGGSGKVIASGPEDHVFVFYSDHGGPGILGMPNYPFLFADQIVGTLIDKHKSNGFRELVFYLEACESGSIFEGLLPPDINVYATTAANSIESSWATYCPGMDPSPPQEFETCLGDLYSVAWMEDSGRHNLAKESLHDQYLIVKARTSNKGTYRDGSHVMEFGNLAIHSQMASFYLGTDPANEDVPPAVIPQDRNVTEALPEMTAEGSRISMVHQRDADLLHFWHKYKNAPEGSARKATAMKELSHVTSERHFIDSSVSSIKEYILGMGLLFNKVRQPGLALVDDWECLRAMVRSFESQCGYLTQYGMKHMSTFAAFCNNDISPGHLAEAASSACKGSRRPKVTSFSA